MLARQHAFISSEQIAEKVGCAVIRRHEYRLIHPGGLWQEQWLWWGAQML